MKMFEEMKELIAEGLNIDESRITEGASFKDDLGADSLDLFELVMSLEDKYDVEIPSEELEKLLTVGDVIKYIEEHK
jgi:acyl carrier protein